MRNHRITSTKVFAAYASANPVDPSPGMSPMKTAMTETASIWANVKTRTLMSLVVWRSWYRVPFSHEDQTA